MKDHLRERQTEGLEEVLPVEMEEETEGNFILRHLQKDIREIDRRRNGRYLLVLEGEAETFLFLTPQNKSHHTELYPLLLPLRIDFLQIGVVSEIPFKKILLFLLLELNDSLLMD